MSDRMDSKIYRDAETKIRELSTLEFFSLCGIPQAVELVIQKNRATNSQALVLRNQDRALNLAISSAYPSTIHILLNHLMIQSLDGPAYRTMIPQSARGGEPELINRIVSLRPSRTLGELALALIQAANDRNFAIVEGVLDGVDVDGEKDHNGMTILHWLFWLCFEHVEPMSRVLGVLDVADLLFSRGADINAQDNLGNTILHYIGLCSAMGYGRVFRRLTDQGARPDIPNRFGWLPIHVLVYKSNDISGIRYLDKYYPEILYKTTRGNSTVLHWAAQRPYSTAPSALVLKYLLCRGLLLDSTNHKGVTPLKLLCENHGLKWELWTLCMDIRQQPLDWQTKLAIEGTQHDPQGTVMPTEQAVITEISDCEEDDWEARRTASQSFDDEASEFPFIDRDAARRVRRDRPSSTHSWDVADDANEDILADTLTSSDNKDTRSSESYRSDGSNENVEQHEDEGTNGSAVYTENDEYNEGDEIIDDIESSGDDEDDENDSDYDVDEVTKNWQASYASQAELLGYCKS